jgi:hypothetical protein
MKEKNRVLVAPVDQLTPAVLHQQGVAVVDGITELKLVETIWLSKGRLSLA